MKKKEFTLLMAAMMSLALTGCGSYKIALNDTNPVHVELGSTLSEDAKDYITVTKGEDIISDGGVFEEITVDTSAVDTDTVGTYSLVIGYEDSELIVPIVVEDTTAPEITVSDLELTAGDMVTAEEYVTATDLEDVTVSFVLADGTQTDAFTYDGEEMTVTARAEDAAGNISEKEFTIRPVVTNEPEQEEEEEVTETETSSAAKSRKTAQTDPVSADAETGTASTVSTANSSAASNGSGTATAGGTSVQSSPPKTPAQPSAPAAPSNPGSGTTGASNPASHVDISDAAKQNIEERAKDDPILNPFTDQEIQSIVDGVLNN